LLLKVGLLAIELLLLLHRPPALRRATRQRLRRARAMRCMDDHSFRGPPSLVEQPCASAPMNAA
jgi:hypothetical protein|tara:strand:- start:25 stop:216 length:192 start_codon:yes stop_codon:yes gene_type:complete